MAKMQIRREDQVNLVDIRKHAQLLKRGDCIVIVDDSHEFSPSESAVYAIVEVPGVSKSQLSAFIAPDVRGDNPHTILRRRGFRFDLDRWNGKPLTLGECLALKVRHAPIHDPDVLGAVQLPGAPH